MKRIFLLCLTVLTALLVLPQLAACSDDNNDPDENNKENNKENNDSPENVQTEDQKVNALTYEFLSGNYLWNDEYKAQQLDDTKSYDKYFTEGLMSLKTNTLDKKPYTYTDDNGNKKTIYTLFSYIAEVPDYTSTRASYDKEKEMSFGLLGLYPYAYKADNVNNNHYVRFVVQGVYPDSPASKAGLDRGYVLEKYDGKEIRVSNYQDVYAALLAPATATSHTLEVFTVKEGQESQHQTITLSSSATYLNPIIKTQVETVEGHKVGFLCYSDFKGGYDSELADELKKFQSEGITDLVLDLRYNLGGHVVSANLLASCIAGTLCEGKIFTEYRYNDTRMKALGNKRPQEKFGEKLSPNAPSDYPKLNLSTVYVLTSYNTASASELVINALRGIDVNVVLIGKATRGKNVGMEVLTVGKGELKGTNLEKKYEIAPITFQSYNAKGFGDYEKGFTPDVEVDEANPFNEEKIIYIYRAFGSHEDYPYAFALEQMTGTTIVKRPVAATRTQGAASAALPGTLSLPVLKQGGMTKAWQD